MPMPINASYVNHYENFLNADDPPIENQVLELVNNVHRLTNEVNSHLDHEQEQAARIQALDVGIVEVRDGLAAIQAASERVRDGLAANNARLEAGNAILAASNAILDDTMNQLGISTCTTSANVEARVKKTPSLASIVTTYVVLGLVGTAALVATCALAVLESPFLVCAAVVAVCAFAILGGLTYKWTRD